MNAANPNTQAKVSMVVSCYNKKDYIGDMLRSVYDQKWDNIEIILVNNASTDGTRNVIGEWEPLLMKRGYDVVIVELEENQGVSGAVKAGLFYVTGDYFCVIDCDDELDSEYVSTMAGWLDEHPEYDWAACDYIHFQIDGAEKKLLPKAALERIPSDPHALENYLFGKIDMTSWLYMARTSYMKSCKSTENFYTGRELTQEAGVFIPLAAGGGRIKYFHKELYKYNRTSGLLSKLHSFEQASKYQVNLSVSNKMAIEKTQLSLQAKRRFILIDEIVLARRLISCAINYRGGDQHIRRLTEEAAALINASFTPSPGITAEQISTSRHLVFAAVENSILGHKYPQITRDTITGRVIGWGALGRAGRLLIPELMDTPLKPDLLWDKSAKPDSELCGMPVAAISLDSLSPEDILLIFPRYIHVLEEIEKTLDERGIVKHIRYHEILNNLSAYKFPVFYGGCEFSP